MELSENINLHCSLAMSEASPDPRTKLSPPYSALQQTKHTQYIPLLTQTIHNYMSNILRFMLKLKLLSNAKSQVHLVAILHTTD